MQDSPSFSNVAAMIKSSGAGEAMPRTLSASRYCVRTDHPGFLPSATAIGKRGRASQDTALALPSFVPLTEMG